MKKFWHITKKVLLVGGIVLALLLIAGFIVVRFYEDDVVNYAVKKFSAQLKTKATVSSVDLVLWSNFPDASLRFNDVYIQETFSSKDTLLFSKKVLMSFNLFDLFSGNYDVKSIEVVKAKANFRVNKKGEDNWHFWKEEQNDTTEERISVNLEQVDISDLSLVYENAKNKFFLDVQTDRAKAEGNFSSGEFEMDVELESVVNSLYNGNTEYAYGKKLQADASIHADTEKEKYQFTKCDLSFDDLLFNVGGSVSTNGSTKLDLNFSGERIDLKDILASLPEGIGKQFSNYEPDGIVTATLKLLGTSDEKNSPDVSAEFKLRDGSLKHISSGVELDHISCSGNYLHENGKDDLLKMDVFTASLEGGEIEANGEFRNLLQPQALLNLKARLGLEDLRNFFSLDTLEMCSGQLVCDAKVEGELKISEADSTFDWVSLRTSGQAIITDAVVKLKESNQLFEHMNATLVLHEGSATISQFSGEVNGSDFEVNGTVSNLVSYLASDSARLNISANLSSHSFDFSKFIQSEASTSRNETYSFSLPDRIDFSFNTSVEKFSFREFVADDVKGIIRLRNHQLSIDPVTFKTADGYLLAQMALEEKDAKNYELRCLATFEEIDITKLFAEFENFGQEFITDKNLRGKTTAKVQFTSTLTRTLKIPPESVQSLIAIKIDNGELVGLESLQQIAAYIRKNKFVAPFVNEDKFAEKLRDIKFSTLENMIEIKNKTITLPAMDVRTSAMDISARGTHTFDNHIDYTVGFNVRDILIRKEKEWQEVDDGLGKQMFIYMRGTTLNPAFGVDKTVSKEERKEKMEEEKQSMKALLKEEFGLFKKDESVGTFQERQPDSSPTIQVQWDETTPPENPEMKQEIRTPKKDKAEATTEKKPKKKLPKWLEEKE